MDDIEQGKSNNQESHLTTHTDDMRTVQLLSFENGTFRLCRDGIEMLEELDDLKIGVVSVVGPKGIGKSYLANAIINRFNGKGVSAD